MNFEDVRNRLGGKKELDNYVKTITEKSRKSGLYVCPLCGSGTHDNKTGAFSVYEKNGKGMWHCHACDSGGDLFDLIGLYEGLKNHVDQVERAAAVFGIIISNNKRRNNTMNNDTFTKDIGPRDFSAYYERAKENIENTTYHRGLSLFTLDHFNVGFDEHWKHPDSENMMESPRLIIPIDPESYLARLTKETSTEKTAEKMKVGESKIFNAEVLDTATQPIFIVEGEIDAMSVYEACGEAVGLGGIGNWKKLTDKLEHKKTTQPLIISLDNDASPNTRNRVENVIKSLEDKLDSLGIAHYRFNISGAYKDPNEALCGDRRSFFEAVENAVRTVRKAEAKAYEKKMNNYLSESVAGRMQDFLLAIDASKTAAFYTTGFKELDNLLDGGIYPGLYVVGAISSLGKTSFCLQIADHAAESGMDVLIFSLEMSEFELMAKSISRMTLLASMEKYKTKDLAKTTRGILCGKKYETYSEDEQSVIKLAMDAYQNIGNHIFISEGVGDIGVKEIREKVNHHISVTGKTPLVIIDYLQIIAPHDFRATDKQNTDQNVLELKRMSRDFNIPVIGISSFNRDNYTAPVNLASFKESGAIEYSSDVLFGLQYEGMDYENGEKESARRERIRILMDLATEDAKNGISQKIQVKVLKNRNGSRGSSVLYFYPKFNMFCDPPETKKEAPEEIKKSFI